ncbi:protein argonaute 18-like [Panicum miliaceum]|uniref:Protein argonaute 18-like n=1 Tax=Panicum miliaceum TaxID=4540 RepID=A0A3L6T634_PANMI|nr:protein argonaute 18-like [Panicum miliaceum]
MAAHFLPASYAGSFDGDSRLLDADWPHVGRVQDKDLGRISACSKAPPAYYAHKLAFRARFYVNQGSDASSSSAPAAGPFALPEIKDELKSGPEPRGDTGGVDRRVGAGFVDAEEGRRRGARAEQLGPGERGVERAGGFGVEGELGEAGPEAVPTAPEQACPGGGAGAAEADEDLEEQVVGQGADAVHDLDAPAPAPASRAVANPPGAAAFLLSVTLKATAF